MWGVSELVLMGLAALLVAAAVGDLRARIIPNGLNAAVALLALPFWWSSGMPLWPDIAIQIGIGFGVLMLFAIAFAMGGMGGGDVKLLAALALWLPLGGVLRLLVIMSIAGGVLTAVMLIRHRMRKSETQLEVPYGVAIAFAGLWLISERFLYHFD